MVCNCCSIEIRTERELLGLPPCRKLAATKVIGIRGFSHKADSDLVIGTRETISELTRNDRRRDRRLKLT